MSQLHNLIDSMAEVQKNCQALMAKAAIFAASKNQKAKVLAYEISISVSKILSEQQVLLKELQDIQAETGAMAE